MSPYQPVQFVHAEPPPFPSESDTAAKGGGINLDAHRKDRLMRQRIDVQGNRSPVSNSACDGADMGLTLGRRVREARELRGLGVNDLDRAIGSRPGYVSRLEGDEFSSVGSEKLRRIAEVLRVSLDWIVMGHGTLELAAGVEEAGRRLKERPNWHAALAEGRQRHRSIDDRFWELAGELSGPGLPARVDAAFLSDIARALQDAAAAGLNRK